MPQVVITINGGSSSIKFAVYQAGDDLPRQLLSGEIQRVGQPGTTLSVKGLGDAIDKQSIDAADHGQAADHLIELLRNRIGSEALIGIGHRVVHGGLHLVQHCIINAEVMTQLQEATELDSAHLPREISLIQAFAKQFPGTPQVACFDTAFHKDLPLAAKNLPIPRKYLDAGIHRFGFHGLSYTYLMQELRRVAGGDAANGRVMLAHLGSGASMAAVKNGKPIDTTMAFTPTAGLVMGTRPGDLDPGLLVYLMRKENLSADQMDAMINKQCGLLGVSGTSADMRDLSSRMATDPHAKEAVDLFCYSAKKAIGALAAAMGGVDMLVFSGGIGEHSPETRAAICKGLDFLGIDLDQTLNLTNKFVISCGPVSVRVIPTNEEVIIASTVLTLTR